MSEKKLPMVTIDPAELILLVRDLIVEVSQVVALGGYDLAYPDAPVEKKEREARKLAAEVAIRAFHNHPPALDAIFDLLGVVVKPKESDA